MILFYFLIGIALILCISRYNESEKLFWTLFISFIGAFAAAVAVSKYISNQKKDKIEYVTSVPTQGLYSSSHIYCVLAEPSVSVAHETFSNPVSKEVLFGKINLTPSEIVGGIRDQPFEFFNTS